MELILVPLFVCLALACRFLYLAGRETPRKR